MTYFLKQGNTFRVSKKEALDIQEQLPAGNYVIKKNEMSGELYLEGIDRFEFKGKVYGDTVKRANRILFSFADRPSATGVMLTGEKGSGKTLLAKNLSMTAAEKGIPTLVINTPLFGESFNKFIQDINQPVVVIFDEFEKVYDSDQQEHVLTLFDGVFPTKKLFVITCNDKWRINQHMRNRPGRIFYSIDFKGLDNEFIREYCEDTLNNKTHINAICQIATLFGEFNFDMLKALVEEMNRYNETPQEASRMLNTKIEYSGRIDHTVSLKYKGVEIECPIEHWSGNPVMERIEIWLEGAPTPKASAKDARPVLEAPRENQLTPAVAVENKFMGLKLRYDENDKYHIVKDDETELQFGPEDIIAIDPVSKSTTYKQGDFELILKKVVPTNYNIWHSAAF